MEPDSDQTAEAWVERVPPVLWPIPVDETPALMGTDFELRGRRVVVTTGPAGHWMYEQRAVTEIHDRQGQPVVGVLSEGEWYRQQRDPSYPAVPHAVPTSRAFYEGAVPMDDSSPIAADQSDIPPASRTVSLQEHPTQPPVRWPRRATRESFLTGARCWVLSPDGPLRGYRAVGEPRREEVGTIDFSRGLDGLDTPVVSAVVPLFLEKDWYRWMDTGEPPDTDRVHAEANLVFLE